MLIFTVPYEYFAVWDVIEKIGEFEQTALNLVEIFAITFCELLGQMPKIE